MYNVIPDEIIRKIYEYDNTYYLKYNKVVRAINNLYKFDNYFTTLKGSLICIYIDRYTNVLCASNQSPYIFFTNLKKNKKKLRESNNIIGNQEEYVNICKTLDIKLWMNNSTYEFFKNKLYLSH